MGAPLSSGRMVWDRPIKCRPDVVVASPTYRREAAERLWPTVAAAEHDAYRALAACWQLEHG